MRVPGHSQCPGELEVNRVRRGQAGQLEDNLRVLRDIEEVGGAQVLVPLLHAGADRLRFHDQPAAYRAVRPETPLATEVGEAAGDLDQTPEAGGAEGDRGLYAVEHPVPSELG